MENSDAKTAKKPKITKKRSKKTLEPAAEKSPASSKSTASKTTDSKTTKSNNNGKSKTTAKTGPKFSDDLRRQKIATAAYYRAEKRGFNGGNPIEDWLMAESEIDSQTSAH